jgi:hypothetical protein
MWGDSLQAFERAHLLRLIVWGAASILAGSAILAWLRVGSHQSALLRHFAIQCAGWGAVDAAIALGQWSRVVVRDIAGATRLDRLLWLNIGLDAGYVLVGVVLALVGWRLGRRLGLVGAGIGIVVQGSALAVLDLTLAAQISR